MAELKDSLLKEREETWNKDKKTLRNQVTMDTCTCTCNGFNI